MYLDSDRYVGFFFFNLASVTSEIVTVIRFIIVMQCDAKVCSLHHYASPCGKQVLFTYEYMILTSYDVIYILCMGHIYKPLHILLLNQDAIFSL